MNKSHITCPERTREQQFHLDQLANSKLSVANYSKIIFEDWVNVAPYAMPYLKAMSTGVSVYAENINETSYYQDTYKECVIRFLCNAASWRGEIARETKKQLKQLCGVK